MPDLILAFDFGGTKHIAGVTGRGERSLRARRQVQSPPGADAGYDINTMIALGREMLAGARPAAIGVSFGGPVDFESGTVRLSHHVPGWEDMPLRQRLEAEFGAPTRVDNDANVAALGELRYGAGQGCRDLLYITVSTGVGGGWILNGVPWRGHESMAGEFGHIRVDPDGPACVCGNHGCVERLAAGPNIAQRARDWLAAQPERGRILRELVGGHLEAIDGKAVATAAAAGDELAWEALAVSARALGVAIGGVANLINPQRFILGGGVTKSGERWWDLLRTTARGASMPEVHYEVVQAALVDDAPLWGAIALAELQP
jgi:glucokinase